MKKKIILGSALVLLTALLLYGAFSFNKPLSNKPFPNKKSYFKPRQFKAKKVNASVRDKKTKSKPLAKKVSAKSLVPTSDIKQKTSNKKKVNSVKTAGTKSTKVFLSVKLNINTGNNLYSYDVTIPDSSTVYDVLKTASKENHFSLKATTYSYGIFIEEIHGVANNGQESTYWLYYVNGALANVGCSSKKVKKGDDILWNYEKT